MVKTDAHREVVVDTSIKTSGTLCRDRLCTVGCIATDYWRSASGPRKQRNYGLLLCGITQLILRWVYNRRTTRQNFKNFVWHLMSLWYHGLRGIRVGRVDEVPEQYSGWMSKRHYRHLADQCEAADFVHRVASLTHLHINATWCKLDIRVSVWMDASDASGAYRDCRLPTTFGKISCNYR